jgi:hypothetical protein
METYASTLTQTDLIDTATVVCTAGLFARLGTYVVTAGEVLSIGYGNEDGYHNSRGRFYALLDSAGPAVSAGVIRISALTAQGRPAEILWEGRSSIVDNNPTDRTKQYPFPQDDLWLTQDKILEFSYKIDATATITLADSVIRLDVTRGAV